MVQLTKDFSIMGSTLSPGGNRNASRYIERLRSNQKLSLMRQPNNPADANAIFVLWGSVPLGYVPRGLAAVVAPLMDSGVAVICRKAPNAMYGVCQLAYIEPVPVPEPIETAELISVEQADELYPTTEEVPDDEQSTDAAG